jgi:hypothetical protein
MARELRIHQILPPYAALEAACEGHRERAATLV